MSGRSRKHGSALARCLLAAALAGCSPDRPPLRTAGGDPQRGRATIERFNCAACHTITGFQATGASVGPPLVNMRSQGYIAGVLPNTPDNLVRWLRDPPAVDPRTAMPKVGLSSDEAADIAAYLHSGK